MRSIQECKNEIFRRSAKKIRERNRRRKIAVGFCIPLCLTLGIFAGVRGGLFDHLRLTKGFESSEFAPTTGFVETEALWEGETMEAVTEEAVAGTDMDFVYAGMPMDAAPDIYVSVSGNGAYVDFYNHIWDEAIVDSLSNRLQELTQEDEEIAIPSEAVPEVSTPDMQISYGQEPEDGFLIDVVDSEGRYGCYFLFDTILEDIFNGNQNNLTEDEYAEISALLELPTLEELGE